jgi:hypothetical protein
MKTTLFSLFAVALFGLPQASLAEAVTSHTQVTTTPAAPADDSDVVSQTQIDEIHAGGTQAPGVAATEPRVDRTVVTERDMNQGGLRNEAVGIKPQFGVLSLNDETRGVVGLSLDINVLRKTGNEHGRPYLGPSFGVLYSHLGFPGSDFFGLNGPAGQDRGTHLLILPLNLKVGYTFSDAIRLAMHGGANVLYSNTSAGTSLGPVSLSVSDSSWSTHPNLGADLELGIGRNVSLLLRPDWTFSDNTLFTGTLGIAFPIS